MVVYDLSDLKMRPFFSLVDVTTYSWVKSTDGQFSIPVGHKEILHAYTNKQP